MKKLEDPRHIRRALIIQKLFSRSFLKDENNKKGTISDIQKIIQILPSIDKHIAKAAPQFPVEKIAKIDVAILRLACYELLYERKTPPKVIIDEAIELAKEY